MMFINKIFKAKISYFFGLESIADKYNLINLIKYYYSCFIKFHTFIKLIILVQLFQLFRGFIKAFQIFFHRKILFVAFD